MSDVFVSYKAEDRKLVQPLVAALEADGLSVWWDVQIGGGAAWRQSIETELNAAKCVVVVWSKRSVGEQGSFVRDEAARAMERGAYLPVKLDLSRPPLGFGEMQALPLAGWKGARDDPRYLAVLASVQAMRGQRAESTAPHPAADPGTSRRGMIAGGSAAAIAIAGFGAWRLLKPSAAEASDSIAVMPFANLSGDPAQAYFSDGMAEELRSALSRVAQLKVVARTSSEAVRDEDVKTAAHKLGVANILTGSIRRSPSTIRISAQLVDGGTGLERWSESFDRPFGDVLKIQTNIAENVASALSIQLGKAGKAALALGGTRNVAAHDLFLKADIGRADDTPEGFRKAIGDLDAATDLDPNYAEAWARKSFALNALAGLYARTPAEMAQGLDAAEQAAQRAIALAPRLPAGHAALAACYQNRTQFRKTVQQFEAAASLPGIDAFTMRGFAVFLGQLRRRDESLEMARRAASVDPLNPGRRELEARVLYINRMYPQAVHDAQGALASDKQRTRVRSILGNALYMLGNISEAEAQYRQLPPDSIHAQMGLAAIAGRSGDLQRSDAILRQMQAGFGENANYQYAQVYAQRRDADRAIAMLRKALVARDPGLAGILVDPFLDPVRDDPRFAAIVANLDFPT